MEGFGKGLSKKTYTGELLHSACFGDFERLIRNLDEDQMICFSTYGSIDRGINIIYKVENKIGLYTPYDADAGKNYGYDEFRCNMTQEQVENIERIDVDQETYDYIYEAEK